jgi:hypothetical protein
MVTVRSSVNTYRYGFPNSQYLIVGVAECINISRTDAEEGTCVRGFPPLSKVFVAQRVVEVLCNF